MDPFGSGLHDLNKNVKIPPLADVTVLSSSVTVMILYETRLMVAAVVVLRGCCLMLIRLFVFYQACSLARCATINPDKCLIKVLFGVFEHFPLNFPP